MTLGEKLKEIRKKHKMSVAKLAVKSGVHPVSIRNYECRRILPSLNSLQKICQALGVGLSIFNDCDMTVKGRKPPSIPEIENSPMCVTRRRP